MAREQFNPGTGVRVDRSTKWGNPFIIGTHGTRKDVVDRYKKWIMADSAWAAKLREEMKKELAGKDLWCWCDPLDCHAHVMLRIINSERV